MTTEYISTNYHDIIPDAHQLDVLVSDFQYLYCNELSEISEPGKVISMLHKYGINTYYKKLLKHIIWDILNLKCVPSTLCLCHDIMTDIINYNSDFSNILKYLLTGEVNIRLSFADFLFSMPLLESAKNITEFKLRYYGDKNTVCPMLAIKYGKKDVIEYLLTNKICKSFNVCLFAAQFNQQEILECAYNLGCGINNQICDYAAINGNIEMLKWAYSHNVPWDSWTCTRAAHNGHFEILKWARKYHCPWDEFTCAYAAKGGHIDILKWLRENGCPWDEITFLEAATNNNFEMIKWLYVNGCPWDNRTCISAAKSGHYEILKWLHMNGCPWDKNVYSYAIFLKHLETLQNYLTRSWDMFKKLQAGRNAQLNYGGLDILEWIYEQGCPWDEHLCTYAACSGHYDVLKWIINKGYPWDKIKCLECVQDNPEITNWIISHPNYNLI